MKKAAAFLCLFLMLAGCPRRIPRPPSSEISGVMYITHDTHGEFEGLRGNFRARGFENKFTVVFSDRAGVPRSEIHVQNRKISHKGMRVQEEFLQLFKYWPVLFYPDRGRKTDELSFSDIVIEYNHWQRTAEGNFPGTVDIRGPNFQISVDIRYAM